MSDVWIYHERQEALLCGQHALNNLVQCWRFTPEALSEIAIQLDEMELAYMAQSNEGGVKSKDYLKRLNEGSANVDPSGNFSIEVLRSALMAHYNLSLPNIRQEGVLENGGGGGHPKRDVTDLDGFICNRESHWFAIRKINGRYWNLNSTLERPELISHFELASEIESLQRNGYSVFCVTQELPPICDSEDALSRGLPQYWWREHDLLGGKTSESKASDADPWKNVGSGMRLDGRPTTATAAAGTNESAAAAAAAAAGSSSSSTTKAANTTNPRAVTDDMSEEEMLQLALAASLQPQEAGIAPPSHNGNGPGPDPDPDPVHLPPEPDADADGVSRIQFRLPDGSRKIRRFFDGDSVKCVYAFVRQTCGGSGDFELRFSFPPRDLAPLQTKTIGEAKLNGENIQARRL